MKPLNIYLHIDMDGVLAEWKSIPKELAGTSAPWLEDGYYYDLKPNESMLNAVKEVSEIENITTTQGISCRLHLGVLSCYPLDSNTALSDKHQWLNLYFPSVSSRLFVPYDENRSGENKLEAVGLHTPREDQLRREPSPELAEVRLHSFHLLFDDFTKNLVDWRNYGGIGVKVLNGINDHHKSWNGPRVNMSSEDLKKDILDTVIKTVSEEIGMRFSKEEIEELKTQKEPEKKPETKNITYEIYQLTSSDKDIEKYMFCGCSEKIDGKTIREVVSISDYTEVHSESVEVGKYYNIKELLENLFYKYNQGGNSYDFRSLSVSDVIVIKDEGKSFAYCVDTFGFSKFPNFFDVKKNLDTQQKGGMQL